MQEGMHCKNTLFIEKNSSAYTYGIPIGFEKTISGNILSDSVNNTLGGICTSNLVISSRIQLRQLACEMFWVADGRCLFLCVASVGVTSMLVVAYEMLSALHCLKFIAFALYLCDDIFIYVTWCLIYLPYVVSVKLYIV